MTTRTRILLCLAMMALPAAAKAESFPGVSDESFENSTLVEDAELAEVRGKFLSLNGVMINFALTSRIEMLNMVDSIHQISDYYISSQQIAQAQANPALIPTLVMPPTILQNAESNVQFNIMRQLDIQVNGGLQNIANVARFASIDVQAVNALR